MYDHTKVILTHDNSSADSVDKHSEEWARSSADCVWDAEETASRLLRKVEFLLKHFRSHLQEGENSHVNDYAWEADYPKWSIESFDVAEFELFIFSHNLPDFAIYFLSMSVHNDQANAAYKTEETNTEAYQEGKAEVICVAVVVNLW